MNNKKIIDYVMQSPNNTNPAVLESMLEAIIGDGGGADSGIKILAVEKMSDVQGQISFPEVTLYKLGNFVPSWAEFVDAILVFNAAANIGGAIRVKQFGGDVVDLSGDIGVTYYLLMERGTDVPLIFVLGENIEEDGQVFEAGTYVSNKFVAFPKTTMMIFGV